MASGGLQPSSPASAAPNGASISQPLDCSSTTGCRASYPGALKSQFRYLLTKPTNIILPIGARSDVSHGPSNTQPPSEDRLFLRDISNLSTLGSLEKRVGRLEQKESTSWWR